MNLRIYIPFLGYFIWNKHLEFGEGTHNEDLWFGGYEFWCFSIFGNPVLLRAKKR